MSSLVWPSLKQGEALRLRRASVAPLPRVGLGRGRGRSQDNMGGHALPRLSELEDRDTLTGLAAMRPPPAEGSRSEAVAGAGKP